MDLSEVTTDDLPYLTKLEIEEVFFNLTEEKYFSLSCEFLSQLIFHLNRVQVEEERSEWKSDAFAKPTFTHRVYSGKTMRRQRNASGKKYEKNIVNHRSKRSSHKRERPVKRVDLRYEEF